MAILALYYSSITLNIMKTIQEWKEFTKKELEKNSGFLAPLGFVLDEFQPHISGERYLMSRNKLVLIGRHANSNERVVIKVSTQTEGKKQIEADKTMRDFLASIPFSKKNINFPKELFFGKQENYTFLITSFIEQDKVFVNRPLEEQFFTALGAFETQEGFHATTFEHIKKIKNTFPISGTEKYLKELEKFRGVVDKIQNEKATLLLKKVKQLLYENRSLIDKYSNYLVHSDFVPHNFRVQNKQLYMLYCAAVEFGNKYEGWARFLNYMMLHNLPLEETLSKYILQNRGEEESLSLKIMRAFKLAYLLNYYANALPNTIANMKELTKIRIDFWTEALCSVLEDRPLSKEVVTRYTEKRNNLRSEEEKLRQREFAVA